MFHLKDAGLINTIRDAGTYQALWCHMCRLTFGTGSSNHSNSPDTAVATAAVDMQAEVETKPSDEGHLLLKKYIFEDLDPNLCQSVAKQHQENQVENQVEKQVDNQEENQGAAQEGPQPDPPQTQPVGSVITRPEDTKHVLTEQGAWCSSWKRTSSMRNRAEKVPEKASAAAGEQKAAMWSNANYTCLSQMNKSIVQWLDNTKQQDALQHDCEVRQPQAEEPLAKTEEGEIGELQEEAENLRGEQYSRTGVQTKAGELGAEIEEPKTGKPEAGQPRIETEEPRAEEAEANLLMTDTEDPNMIVQVLNAEVSHEVQEVTAGDAPEQDHTEAMEEEVTREQEAAGNASAKATVGLKVPAGGAVERQYTATAIGRVLTACVAVTEKTSPTEGATEQQDEDSDAELLSEPEQIGSTPTPPLEEEEGAPQWPEGDEWDAVELDGDKAEGAGPQEDALTITVTISGLRSAIKIYISPVEPHRRRTKQRRH